jgi:uncharacterized linocin/CFP29 family protein
MFTVNNVGTAAQKDHVVRLRNAHAKQHEIMSANHGELLEGNASPIPRDAWGVWDKDSIEVGREVLTVFSTLAVNTYPLPIGKIVHHFQTVSDSGAVNISLDGKSSAKLDQPVMEHHGTPVPILDSSFGFGWREVSAAQTEGVQLDSAGSMNAVDKVANALEDLALDGSTKIVVNNAPLYGLRTHPKRNTRTTGSALAGATAAVWVAQVRATIQLLRTANFKVPATIFLNDDDWYYAETTLADESNSNSKYISQLILEMAGVGEVVGASKVTASQIIAVIKDKRVVQVLSGMPITTRSQFRANPEDDYNFRTLAAASLEIKFTANNECGIAVSSI